MKYLVSALLAVLLLGGLLAVLVLTRAPRGGPHPGKEAVKAMLPGATESPAGAGEHVAGGGPSSLGGPPPARPPMKAPARGSAATDDAGEEAEKATPIASGDAEIVFIVTRDSGEPFQRASVTLLSGRSSSTALTDAAGVADFPGIAPGVYTFRLEGEGLPQLGGAREISLSPGERREVPIEIGGFQLSIAGRVLDRAGNPVAAMKIHARKHVFEAPENVLVRSDEVPLEGVSGPDGTYEIGGLDEGDYLLGTEKTDVFPATRRVYRSGTRSADLVLDSVRELALSGTVTSRAGGIIAGASVVPLGQPERQAESDGRGRYSTRVELTEGLAIHILSAFKEGYREGRVQFRPEDVGSAESWEVDIVLDPMGPRAEVAGFLRDSAGAPVKGETVFLHSPSINARYQATSGEDGRFSAGEVQVGDDYRLWIYPRAQFRDYSRPDLGVPEEGLELELVLEPIESATLHGAMVDPEGRPVPRFTLWLRSLKALNNSIAVTGDAAGRFVAEGVPEGEILFETRSLPRFTVRGFRLHPGGADEVTLVLDRGSHACSGIVNAQGGGPISGASVSLYWSHSEKGIQSSSFRSAVTDASGRFSFTELGPGDHKISVNSTSHLPSHASHDVGKEGQDVVIELGVRRP